MRKLKKSNKRIDNSIESFAVESGCNRNCTCYCNCGNDSYAYSAMYSTPYGHTLTNGYTTGL